MFTSLFSCPSWKKAQELCLVFILWNYIRPNTFDKDMVIIYSLAIFWMYSNQIRRLTGDEEEKTRFSKLCYEMSDKDKSTIEHNYDAINHTSEKHYKSMYAYFGKNTLIFLQNLLQKFTPLKMFAH